MKSNRDLRRGRGRELLVSRAIQIFHVRKWVAWGDGRREKDYTEGFSSNLHTLWIFFEINNKIAIRPIILQSDGNEIHLN